MTAVEYYISTDNPDQSDLICQFLNHHPAIISDVPRSQVRAVQSAKIIIVLQ